MLSLMHGAGRVYVHDCGMSRDDGVLLPPDVVTAWSENEQGLSLDSYYGSMKITGVVLLN